MDTELILMNRSKQGDTPMTSTIRLSIRVAGMAVICMAALLGVASAVQAQDYTSTDYSQFDIVEASSSSSSWTTRGCRDSDDVDDGCYIEVRADDDLRKEISGQSGDSPEERWKAYFNATCDDRIDSGDDYHEQNEDFNDCWENNDGTVIWPQVGPSEYFEATGFCKSGDSSCSIRINICYNANECDDRTGNDDEFDVDDGRQADFWDDASSCLYDVSDRRLTECINDELEDVYDTLYRRGEVDFDSLEEELFEMGVEIERYSKFLSRVEDESYFGNEYVTYPPTAATHRIYPRAAYQPGLIQASKPWIDLGSWPRIPGYSPITGDFIVVPFTQHLESQPLTEICGTAMGCINVAGRSNFFAYMGNISIVIRDHATISCMRGRGYAIGRGTLLEYNDPNLRACDRRMAAASDYCPACGEGAKAELLKLYRLGLIPSVINQGLATSIAADLNNARRTAPSCLCSAGFRSADLVVSTSTSRNPWEPGANAYFSSICG